MEEREYKIGERFQFGLKTLECKKEDAYYSCDECAFKPYFCATIKRYIGYCSSNSRSDKQNVYFKEVD